MVSYRSARAEAVDDELWRGLAFGLLAVTPFWIAVACGLWFGLR